MSAAPSAATLRRRLFGIVVLVLLGLLTHGTFAGTGDEPHYLAIAHSIAFDRDLDLANNYGGHEPLIADGGLQAEAHVQPGAGGVSRPVHDIGMPLLFAPYVRVAAPAVAWSTAKAPPSLLRRLRVTPSVVYRHSISAAMIVLAASLAMLMFESFMSIGLPARLAFWTALLIALSPPLLIHAILFFTELLTALLAFIVFRRIALDRHVAPAPTWALAGAATGLLLLVHVRNAGLVAGLALVAVHRLARRDAARELSAFFAPLAALLVVRTLVNHRLWGTWITTPHAHAGPWSGWADVVVTAGGRLAGMLLDQEFGLLPYAPVFVLAAAGLFLLARTRRALAGHIGIVVGCYLVPILLTVTNVHGWTGGWSPAARFMVPIVPMLALGVAAAMPTMPRLILVPLVAVQIAIDGYMWQHPKSLWNDGDGIAAVCSRGGAIGCSLLPSYVDWE